MPRLFIGNRGEGPGVVRIMADQADDPVETPTEDYAKFLFNSEVQKLGYLLLVRDVERDVVTYPTGEHFIGGTNADNCEVYINTFAFGANLRQTWRFHPERIFGLDYTTYGENRRYAGLNVYQEGVQWSYNMTGEAIAPNWQVGFYQTFLPFDVGNEFTLVPNSSPPNIRRIYSGWDLVLQGADVIDPPSDDPEPGQKNVVIRPDRVAISRPGFDVDTASFSQLVMDSDKVPAKVIAAGEVTLGNNQTAFIPSPIELTPTTYVDYLAWPSGQPISHPLIVTSPDSSSASIIVDCRVESDGVTIRNRGSYSATVRYMVLADDATEPSTGGSRVFVQDNDGDTDYIQIKRPGSDDAAPQLNDILLDTRFTYLPILAEGYIAAADMTEAPVSNVWGNKSKTITFDNRGLKPFLKFATRVSSGGYMRPLTRVLRTFFGAPTTWNMRQARPGTPALLTDTTCRFHMAETNPSSIDLNGHSASYQYADPTPIGIRYWIFGVPA